MGVGELLLAGAIGVAAGISSGLLGIGGGILFVPALTLVLGLGHVEAESTSLLAIVPVALVGSFRQRSYGNLRVRDAGVIGLLSVGGAVAGVALANVLPVLVLRIGFALLMLNLARQLFQRGRRDRRARLAGAGG
ncbi:TSUP family transporter [Conexibacter sp. JD483]|uniref:TSUP family transporter n=1 Tax=unclassified Conexibacter TaxID=2627773 RepID=UPI00271CA55C|nr:MULTISPECIES: TSUP family transporter [unclassified Conexibacter]MDO8185391.1 TSUP family transporter [Conexibacter sp. CPCC 205706]MDO8198433.1 TSUP family transporter [Conexibacter sp. CPCC 205762]MDR9371641.1 TSUP family transporter [Conexibacter sp. JD483]